MARVGDEGFESGGSLRMRYGPRIRPKALVVVAGLLGFLVLVAVAVALTRREPLSPSPPGPLAGSWRVVAGKLPRDATTMTFSPGRAAADKDETDAVFQLSDGGKKAIVKREGQPDLTLDLPERNVATGAGGLYMLKIVNASPVSAPKASAPSGR